MKNCVLSVYASPCNGYVIIKRRGKLFYAEHTHTYRAVTRTSFNRMCKVLRERLRHAGHDVLLPGFHEDSFFVALNRL